MTEFKYKKISLDEYGVHQKIVRAVQPKTVVLEIGCAYGYITRELTKKGCKVYCIEKDFRAAQIAASFCRQIVVGDIEEKDILEKVKVKKFGTIIFADVLEHLKNPVGVLKRSVEFLNDGGRIIISVPNISFVTNRLTHLLGKFDYTKTGIMDESHLHFFTKKSISELIDKAGLRVSKFDYVGNFTQLPFYMQTLYPFLGKKTWSRKLEYKITSFWTEGLAVQFILACQKK
ncbi:hypothetical protein A3D00_01940 [Candidatus Woesebacteria bacterium RIFCSPHIGHO2_02_FULL_38_9]|uniref:Uncharacterized protein n=1 Tax=Candidatus Woesebacteria bacterium RIFCSPHIGHO2_01_FULL_39_28 TaxID=1802496 RepID=A0A1F7YKH7_9BACT|nr:MAG: hypothetical protein A2627_02500 [Candidatus Woesebacteria bacterium RIFCSPHIGHO2_01_FULL_39_28]OGM32211.1 MAG: hypothetical protein A3D00_01940 [Candidatus Woesebacteria bacterium RIFCSPHIGHO2_02_FULL_38_9]OGM57198.1 MAG: hypothetical protein A3A50_03360 [Candidatus Woesebacteria bacterium RIFCSPLOWO2_01_FULL_38_20]